MTTTTRPTVTDTRELARDIVQYINSGRQWTIDQLGIPSDLYAVERLDESDMHPVTVTGITAALRAVVR